MGKMKETDLAMLMNNATAIDYFDRLKLIAISLFKWKNLDKICGFGAEAFLENSLFEFGRACFIKDKDLGFMVLNVNPSDKLNNYRLPTKVEAYSIEYHKQYKLDDIVYIKNNKLEKPTEETINLFSYRLYESERIIDVNLKAQKTPVLIEGDEKSMLTLKNLYMQYDGNVPFIFGNKNFDLNNKINSVKTDAPYIVDKIELHKHEIWNEALTFLGINNANTDKKERLITNEVDSNNELISYYLSCFYDTRKQACDMINEKFLSDKELKIELELNKEVAELLKQYNISNEGDEFGEIYDNN